MEFGVLILVRHLPVADCRIFAGNVFSKVFETEDDDITLLCVELIAPKLKKVIPVA